MADANDISGVGKPPIKGLGRLEPELGRGNRVQRIRHVGLGRGAGQGGIERQRSRMRSADAGLAQEIRRHRPIYIGDTLETATVPDWARLPLMDIYKRDRRLRVGTVIGEAWRPTCGVMAGCGIAVSALAVCTRPWAVTVGIIPNTHRRLYVEDPTAWIIGRWNR